LGQRGGYRVDLLSPQVCQAVVKLRKVLAILYFVRHWRVAQFSWGQTLPVAFFAAAAVQVAPGCSQVRDNEVAKCAR
jgi:hypothetical protein